MTREMQINNEIEAIITRDNVCAAAPSIKYDMCRIYDGERLLMFATVTNNNTGGYHVYKANIIAYEMMMAFVGHYANVHFEEI